MLRGLRLTVRQLRTSGAPPRPKHAALQPDRVAVITGAANGIGLAVAQECATLGMKVVLADLNRTKLEEAVKDLVATGAKRDNLLAFTLDVSNLEQNQALCEKTYEVFKACHFVLFNAGINTGNGESPIDMNISKWRKTIETNLWGTLYGIHCFVPRMLAQTDDIPSIVAATSSRQGLTLNPGDTSYVISKVSQRAVMESLEHELRNLANHKLRGVLLCPGRTVTDIQAAIQDGNGNFEQAAKIREDLKASWGPNAMPPSHPVQVLFEAIDEGKFYAVCTDHYKTKTACFGEIKSSADDVIENRPPLSRWHPDFQPSFLRDNPEAKEVPLPAEKRPRL
eukprot:gnl/TRDRNA2_/TRDRNA2_41672_c0_seq1.p1 gnl/TRDRNA2_/TRDRNA2_41672_c0~~gnl/TRDRNA2_/TRDRNA2_41672_c0_seq1.p1  ORF type:complete len:338 (+),score=38.69 gnl/TRDRNA2_/TRDRNA2_41672_c0_seq1:1-1014(+)